MADYAGAVAAIKERLAANWSTTPITYQNEAFDPPVDSDTGDLLPWAALEVLSTANELRGAGTPGDHVWNTIGLIYVHVFVPFNTGIETAQQYAVTIGEIFRAREFYQDGNGACVRTGYGSGPHTDGGGTGDDRGATFRVTMVCEFEFLFRA